MLQRLSVLFVFLGVLGSYMCTAHAQEETPKARMHILNEKGFELFAKGEFESAARSFSQAYDLYPDINLRKNESLAWFKHGNCERARTVGRLFLDAPNITQADKKDARTVMVRCTLTLAKQALAENETYKAQLYLDEASSMPMSIKSKVTHKQLSDELALQKAANTPPPPSNSNSMIGWGLTGVGAATLLGTVVYHIFISDDEEELQTISLKGGDRARYDKLAGRLGTAKILLPVLYVTGALSLAAGGTLLVLPSIQEPTQPNAQRPVGVNIYVRF